MNDIIRYAEAEEIESLGFALYDADNEGEDIIVCERDSQIVAFAQATANRIFFLESNAKGAGTAIVDWFKDRHDYIVADSCDRKAAGYWQHVGFELLGQSYSRSSSNDYDWYAE